MRTVYEMERDELILRCEDNSQNPRAVYYELSPVVREFLDGHTRGVVEWAQAHHGLFDRVRRRGNVLWALPRDNRTYQPTPPAAVAA